MPQPITTLRMFSPCLIVLQAGSLQVESSFIGSGPWARFGARCTHLGRRRLQRNMPIRWNATMIVRPHKQSGQSAVWMRTTMKRRNAAQVHCCLASARCPMNCPNPPAQQNIGLSRSLLSLSANPSACPVAWSVLLRRSDASESQQPEVVRRAPSAVVASSSDAVPPSAKRRRRNGSGTSFRAPAPQP